MVDLLWRAENKQAALRLEAMWNKFAGAHSLSLLCAYVMGHFFRAGDGASLREVCRVHGEARPAEGAPLVAEPETERREISVLQRHARTLEHEIEDRKELEGALREALVREKEAREEAERSVRYNEMFAGMLGHDLRNPLSAITTGANYIARLNAHQKTTKAASRILSSAERMARMIDQLLDFTRIRVGGGLALTRTRFDLEELLCKVKDELEAANPERSILVEVEGNAMGEWDHDRLLQVFANLVGNALHHGRSEHPVKVRCNGRRTHLSVSVQNAGAVPPEVLPVLFEPFRGTARYQRTRGLGLGLFITQQIVAAHGGTIDVASDATAGTTFRLLLPRKAPKAAKARAALKTRAETTVSNTIVVVDDEETICETLKDVLEDEGYTVACAGDGVEALSLLRGMTVLPRMVILDLLMPRMDGNAVLTTIRADPTLADIPVVISTSDPSRAPSGVLIMRKPVDLDMLLDTVRKQG